MRKLLKRLGVESQLLKRFWPGPSPPPSLIQVPQSSWSILNYTSHIFKYVFGWEKKTYLIIRCFLTFYSHSFNSNIISLEVENCIESFCVDTFALVLEAWRSTFRELSTVNSLRVGKRDRPVNLKELLGQIRGELTTSIKLIVSAKAAGFLVAATNKATHQELRWVMPGNLALTCTHASNKLPFIIFLLSLYESQPTKQCTCMTYDGRRTPHGFSQIFSSCY